MTIDDAPPPDTSRETLQSVTARAAQAAPWLAAAGVRRRCGLLTAIAAALEADAANLVRLADAETALGQTRLTGELTRTTNQLRFFADVIDDGAYLEVVIDHADADVVPPRPDLRRMRYPIGPVAVFAASNFPFAFSVAGGDTASAIAAGCPVVVKAHPGHPRLSAAVAGILRETLTGEGAPDGVFALVHGHDAGRDLVLDPHIAAVGFTGSLAGGRALFDLASSRPDPIPFFGELGSLNPVVVTAAAARERGAEIARGLVASFTMGAGQFCTKPGVVLVPEGAGVEARVADALTAAASQRNRMLTPGIAAGFHAGVANLAHRPAVTVVAGEVPETAPETAPETDTASPVVLTAPAGELLRGDRSLVEEYFGPATLLLTYRSGELDDAVALLPGSLTATVHGQPQEAASLRPLLAALRERAGRVIWNGWPTGVAVTWAQHHGGPWPATTSSLHTSVGAAAIHRFLRPVTYQDVPDELLPEELREGNPCGLPRRVDGVSVA